MSKHHLVDEENLIYRFDSLVQEMEDEGHPFFLILEQLEEYIALCHDIYDGKR